MKREDLAAMGLTDEQIEKVIAENGKDVQAANAKANKNSEELTRLRELEKEYTAILDTINEMKSERSEMKKELAEHEQKLTKVEASTASAHHRLDGIEERLNIKENGGKE